MLRATGHARMVREKFAFSLHCILFESGLVLPCAHGPSRAASLMLPYVREANERTTSWIRFGQASWIYVRKLKLYEIQWLLMELKRFYFMFRKNSMQCDPTAGP